MGAIVLQQSFNAWGRMRNPTNWSYTGIPSVPDWLYRGFTGHEYVAQFALINMNGRIYDPVIGRMLSPDNYVQAPFATQSYNRFGYCINNPLKYTDPSGEIFGIDDLFNGIVGAVINFGSQLISGNIHSLGQAFGYLGVGFVSGVSVEYATPIGAGVIAGAGNAWVAGGSLMDIAKGAIIGAIGGAAGQAGGQLVGDIIGNGTGIINGAIKGVGGGITGGFTAGTANGLLNGNGLGQSIKIGLNSAIEGAAIGGASGGIDAYQRRLNIWSGKSLTTNNQVIIGQITGEFVPDDNQLSAPDATLDRGIEGINQNSRTITLKDGFYEADNMKISEGYYNRLWRSGRGAPFLTAREILTNATMISPDYMPGFYSYTFGNWHMVYNPSTTEIWHIQPIR